MKKLTMLIMATLLISCGKKEEEPSPNLDALNGCHKRRLLSMDCDLAACNLRFEDIVIRARQGYYSIGQTYCVCSNQLANQSACYGYGY